MALEVIGSLGQGFGRLTKELPRVLSELQSLKLQGPLVGAAANAVIAMPITPNDTFIKVLSFAAGAFTDQTANTTVAALTAIGTITVGAVVDGDSVSVRGTKFTFKNLVVNSQSNVATGVIPIGANANVTAQTLAAAIQGQAAGVSATAAGAVVTVKALTSGTAANAYTLTQTGGHVTLSGATFAGGLGTGGIKISVDTTGAQVFVLWFQKPNA